VGNTSDDGTRLCQVPARCQVGRHPK
jgi:hypothetical protein